MTTSRMMMPTMRHMRIFMSFHHICLRTRLAPFRKPWADTARLSVLSWSESRRAPRSETLLMLSRMMPTVLSISWMRVSPTVAAREAQRSAARQTGCDNAKHAARLRYGRSWGHTYRLERCCADVAILALAALLATCTAGGDVRVVGLLAVGHGG